MSMHNISSSATALRGGHGWSRRLGTVLAAVTALSVPLLLNSSAAHAGVLDQEQDQHDDISYNIFEGRSTAQTFTAGRSGPLDQVELVLARQGSPAVDLTVEIRTVLPSGAPSAEVLAEATVPTATPPAFPSRDWIRITFTDPATVEAGSKYAIVAHAPAAPLDDYGWFGVGVNVYSGGSGWISSDSPSGETWLDPGDVPDFAFRTYVAAPADVSVTLTDTPDPIGVLNLIGPSQLTYTAVVTNNGPDDASDVVLSDELPDTMEFAAASATGGATCSHTDGTVTCGVASLANGQSFTATIKVTPQQVGTANNTVTVASADDPDSGNDTAATTTTVRTVCLQIDGIRVCV